MEDAQSLSTDVLSEKEAADAILRERQRKTDKNRVLCTNFALTSRNLLSKPFLLEQASQLQSDSYTDTTIELMLQNVFVCFVLALI